MKTVPLECVADIERSIVDPTSIEANTRYVGLEHIDGSSGTLSGITVSKGELASTKFQFSSEHILLGKLRPYLRKIVRPDFEGICSTDIIPIRPKKELDKNYLYYFLRQDSIINLLTSLSIGANLPRISPNRIAEIEIPLPPLDEQKRIAAILDQADALRKARRRAITRLNDLSQSIFYDMFGEPKSNPKKLQKTELGNLFKVKSGEALTSDNQDPSGKIPVYGGNGITGYHTQYLFDEPKLVIGRVGVYCGSIYKTEPYSWVTDNALYVVEIPDHITIDYLEAALRVANLNQYAGRSSQPLVSGHRIYPIEILVPPLDKQLLFQKKINHIKQLSIVHTDSAATLQKLFVSIQQRAFRGEL